MTGDAWRRAAVQQLESLLRSGVDCFPQLAEPPAGNAPAPTTPSTRVSSSDAPGRSPSGAAGSEAAPAAPSGKTPAAPSTSPAVTSRRGTPGQSQGGPPAPTAPQPAAPQPAAPPAPAATTAAQRQVQLDVIAREVAACTVCQDLQNRTQTVFGVGNPEARICFFGEAPGEDEDRQGEPFVGRAGQLLNRIIAACKLTREEVYILNVLKCRPPGNRAPEAEEVGNCRHFFERQLEIINPQYVVCLGASAAQALLQTTTSVGRLRGRFHQYRDAKVVVTYHPSYLLREESAKRATWDDMKMLMRDLGVEL